MLEERERRNEANKLKYQQLLLPLFDGHKNGVYTSDALAQTETLLQWNPETYTVWNYRREILLHTALSSHDDARAQAAIDAELALVQKLLPQHPKVYWLWNHRRWCLEQAIRPDWQRELGLVTKLLTLDSRNFHGWNYRRVVIAEMERQPQGVRQTRNELEYTRAAIDANFSNFSAWHYRTKLIPKFLDELPAGEAERARTRSELLAQEREIIKEALYTDPYDQSIWYYHRWLVGSGNPAENGVLVPRDPRQQLLVVDEELANVLELLDLEPEAPWCLDSAIYLNFVKLDLLQARCDRALAADLEAFADRLIRADPLRKGRYVDLKTAIAQRRESE